MVITKEDIYNLARISMLDIRESDIPILTSRLNNLLDYVSCLKDLADNNKEESMPHNINIFREDNIIKNNNLILLDLAPQKNNNYFVVPAILEKK